MAIDRAITLMARTEAELRKLVSEAADAGAYGDVLQLASWARTLSEIVAGSRSREKSLSVHGSLERPDRPVKKKGSTSSLKQTNGYPRFFRRGDRLVRVAWSKSEKKEYEHKASTAVLKALSLAMTDKGSGGRVYTMDELLPLHDDEGAEIPSYQAYTWVAFLKHAGLIDQHGREGYSIPRLPEFRAAADALWRNLPERK